MEDVSQILQGYIEGIKPADKQAYIECIKRFDGVAKPLGGLGKLEEIVAKIGSVRETTEVRIDKREVLVCCADNGVTKCGVSQSDSSVTMNIARSLVAGTASVSIMARSIDARVCPINMGMYGHVDGMADRRVVHGTENMCVGPAMTRIEVIRAIIGGIEEVALCKKRGVDIICTGEAGIGNTTTSAAVASVLLEQDVKYMVGRGAGLSDEGVVRKMDAIRNAIDINVPDKDDAIDVLAKVGGADIAGMVGIYIGGAYYHIPVVMDGVISAVAALCAHRLCKSVSDYIIPSHMSSEIAMKYICDELKLEPILYGGFHLGEGTGAVAVLPLIDMALHVYYEAARFDDIGVEQYTKQ